MGEAMDRTEGEWRNCIRAQRKVDLCATGAPTVERFCALMTGGALLGKSLMFDSGADDNPVHVLVKGSDAATRHRP